MFYALEGDPRRGIVHEFDCVRARKRWLTKREDAFARSQSDWIVQQALRENRVKREAATQNA